MKTKCINCPAEIELGSEGEDIGDTRYKLLCPVLREHFKKDADRDCPFMRAVKYAAVPRRKRLRSFRQS